MAVKARVNYIHTIYFLVVTLAGFVLLAGMFGGLDLDRSSEFAVLILLGILVEGLAVNFPLGRLSGGFSIVLASFLIYNLNAAAWISSLAFFLGNGIANRGGPVRTLFFNTGQQVLALYVSASLSGAIWGREMSGIFGGGLNAGYLQLITLILLYFAINHLLVFLYTYPGRREARMYSWQATLRWDALSYLFSAPFGIAMAILYQKTGIASALLLVVPILAVQFILGLYVRSELVNKELRAVYEITRKLGFLEDIDSVPGILLNEMRRAVPFHSGVVYLWQEEKRRFVAAAAFGPYKDQLERDFIRPEEGFWGWVISNGEPEIIFNSKMDPRVKSEQGLPQVLRSLLAIPLASGNNPLGLVIVGEKKAMAFDERDLETAVSLCGTVTRALSNGILSKRVEKLRKLDPQTGLLNRKWFYRNAVRAMDSLIAEGNVKAALLLVDIDILGHINEGWGQEDGDRIIDAVAEVLRGLDAPGGFSGRYGDDEFALFLPGGDEGAALELAGEIRAILSEIVPCPEHPVLTAKVSIGIAAAPENGESLDRLIKMAGLALREAKKKGRDRIETASGIRGRRTERGVWNT
ncbi:MAG: diguanylate cyclase [Bacillota bacterium]